MDGGARTTLQSSDPGVVPRTMAHPQGWPGGARGHLAPMLQLSSLEAAFGTEPSPFQARPAFPFPLAAYVPSFLNQTQEPSSASSPRPVSPLRCNPAPIRSPAHTSHYKPRPLAVHQTRPGPAPPRPTILALSFSLRRGPLL